MIPLPLLAAKPGRRAWLPRRWPAALLLPSNLHRALACTRLAEKGISDLGEELRAQALQHVAAAFNTAYAVPGLRATQRRRMFYFMCDMLNCSSDSCYALGRLYLEYRRQVALEGCDPAATTSELLRRISRPPER